MPPSAQRSAAGGLTNHPNPISTNLAHFLRLDAFTIYGTRVSPLSPVLSPFVPTHTDDIRPSQQGQSASHILERIMDRSRARRLDPGILPQALAPAFLFVRISYVGPCHGSKSRPQYGIYGSVLIPDAIWTQHHNPTTPASHGLRNAGLGTTRPIATNARLHFQLPCRFKSPPPRGNRGSNAQMQGHVAKRSRAT
jgi:hypothetical protein